MEKNSVMEEFQLENGLTCYAIQKPGRLDNFAVCLSVKAGAAYESRGERGWFHFLEHLSIYPSLYHCVDDRSTGRFLAFDYAYTSFYETAFWFHGTDGTGKLLMDSLKTAKGILDGSYLTEEAFDRTRADVLEEYEDFAGRHWFGECVTKLRERETGMPVGEKEDILRADYGQLVRKHHRYYRADHAALVIESAKSAAKIRGMLEEIFKPPSFLCLAWLPRSPLPVPRLLQNYMEMAMVSRAVELVCQELEWVGQARCEVEIFSMDTYLFRLSLAETRAPHLKQRLENGRLSETMFFSDLLFEQARTAVGKQLHAQYDETYAHYHGEEIMDSCREHFLFGEPILDIENEYEIFCGYLQECCYKDVKEKFDEVIRQFEEGWKMAFLSLKPDTHGEKDE